MVQPIRFPDILWHMKERVKTEMTMVYRARNQMNNCYGLLTEIGKTIDETGREVSFDKVWCIYQTEK